MGLPLGIGRTSHSPTQSYLSNTVKVTTENFKHYGFKETKEFLDGEERFTCCSVKENAKNSPDHFSTKTRRNLCKHATDSLKLWLFFNLDDPYPSEKLRENMAVAYGLTLTQVNDWFINGRRRYLPLMRKLYTSSAVKENKTESCPVIEESSVTAKKRKSHDFSVESKKKMKKFRKNENNSAKKFQHQEINYVIPFLPFYSFERIVEHTLKDHGDENYNLKLLSFTATYEYGESSFTTKLQSFLKNRDFSHVNSTDKCCK